MVLSIIIVNFNVRYHLEQCLHAVRKAAAELDHEVIVVDNASADESRAYLTPLFPEVRFIWNSTNEGFAKANNIGLAVASGTFVLFLNPDTILPEDCLTRSLKHMDLHPKAGALGIRMLDGHGRFLRESKRGFPTPLTALFKLTGLSTLFPRSSVFSRYHMGHLDPLKNHVTDVLAGAFMLVRKNILNEIGGFDEAFFMYGEDIDLSYRIQKAGWENHYFAESSILHFKGESTSKGTLNYVKLFYSAMAIFAKKHYGSRRAGLFAFFLQLGIWTRAFVSAAGLGYDRLFANGYRKIQTTEIENTKAGMPEILIAADEKNMKRVVAILGAAGQSRQVLAKLDIGTLQPEGNLTNLCSIIESFPAKKLVCCPDGLSYRQIITLVERLPAQLSVCISAGGTRSIAGSHVGIGFPEAGQHP